MSAKHIACGPFANKSEELAVQHLKAKLDGARQAETWVLLSNLSHSSNPDYLADELDLIVVGPSGIHIIEVKHWDRARLDSIPSTVLDAEANKLNRKVKRIKGTIEKKTHRTLPFLEGALLLTDGEGPKARYVTADHRRRQAGVPYYGLVEWKELLKVDGPSLFSALEIEQICEALSSDVKPSLTGEIRSFGEFRDLERLDLLKDPFHRVYRGRKRVGQDRVVLHVYDLSALKEKDPHTIAKREFEAYRRLIKLPCIPDLVDSFQEAAAYPGELYFFSHADSEARPLGERLRDMGWADSDRLRFAIACVDSLSQIQEVAPEAVLHRNLSPTTILVRSSGGPLFTGLQFARLPGEATLAGTLADEAAARNPFAAPEIADQGLGGSTTASDTYSLCASLLEAFPESADDSDLRRRVRSVLELGRGQDPKQRPSIRQLRDKLERLVPKQIPDQTSNRVQEASASYLPSSARYWDEETTIQFGERWYRVINRLGEGGNGSAFKVMEVKGLHDAEDRSGPYVAKVITNEKLGSKAVDAYARVRPMSGEKNLAGVLQVSPVWKPDEVTALLRWVDGDALDNFSGVIPLYLEDLGETDPEAAVLSWLADLCRALRSLHEAGLVHGDVSPKNIIVHRSQLTLTDFDLVVRSGEPCLGGTSRYCAPEVDRRLAAAPWQDLYALGATFFYEMFDRAPFLHGDTSVKSQGLCWDGIDRSAWPRLVGFLDRATHPDPNCRFSDAADALTALETLLAPAADSSPDDNRPPALAGERCPNEVPWLNQLLQAYPASHVGNAETRGLDSDFARETYVETELDEHLAGAILSEEIRLVILCGNAGDGKTAFLQHLARNLGMDPGHSSQRLWDHKLENGIRVRANLDGSAAFQGRSATELLNEFFEPFMHGEFPDHLVHLIAINDGPLFAWLESQEATPLTEELERLLDDSHWQGFGGRIRFIDLNTRSLVGGCSCGGGEISTEFLDKLIAKLLGERDQWFPCETCIEQPTCVVHAAVQALHSADRGPVIRARLARALQAVHHRGETHITARSLRAALVYIFFGTETCAGIHQRRRQGSGPIMPYWDRAFDAASPERQGELLQEFAAMDPGADSHPILDRYLLKTMGQRLQSDSADRVELQSRRRQAFFEWSDSQLQECAGRAEAITLRGATHLSDFQAIATGSDKDRRELRDWICEGISRLEDLPEEAYSQDGWPLRVATRIPTESLFWVLKRKDQFKLSAGLDHAAKGVAVLHTHAELTYTFASGHTETLRIDASLFNLLMEIRLGYQLSDQRSDDIFASLSIFKQRLAQEDQRHLYAWNPLDDRVFLVQAALRDGVQKLIIAPVAPQ